MVSEYVVYTPHLRIEVGKVPPIGVLSKPSHWPWRPGGVRQSP